MKPVAVMREPACNFFGPMGGGVVVWETALKQHRALQGIYRRHGYKVELLPPSMEWNSSVFMQDTAFVHRDQAILLNLSSSWRTKEARLNDWELASLLGRFFRVERLGLPATLDGGEFVVTDKEILVGTQTRAARRAVAQIRAKLDLDRPLRTWTPTHHEYVHLGSEMSYIGEGCLLTTPQFFHLPAAKRYDTYLTERGEENAANAVRLHDGTLIMQDDCPGTVAKLRSDGWEIETTDISEYNKGNGHLSCLSINFVPLFLR